MDKYQVFLRSESGDCTSVVPSTGTFFPSEGEAVEWLTENVQPGRVYVVLKTSGVQEYTVEETRSRTLHRLRTIVGSM